MASISLGQAGKSTHTSTVGSNARSTTAHTALGCSKGQPQVLALLPPAVPHGHSLGFRVVLSPDPFELVQVVGAQDGPVTCEVVKVVHDDSHKEINDLRAKERVEACCPESEWAQGPQNQGCF